ncbi:MAG: BrnA antitoxin family protein [Zoogloeaceae bacterium]|nr:BrnA antitoxin family protein [Zoogloeaceae bacterium]
MSDPDARPFTGEELALARAIRRGGRSRVAAPKKSVCIRLSPDVAEAFRATSKGWQTRSKKLAAALQGCRSNVIGKGFLSPPHWLRSKPRPSGRGSNLRTALKGGVSNRS